MFQRVGHPVMKLRRVAIGPVRDPGLPSGALRELTEAEVESLRRVGKKGGKARPKRDKSGWAKAAPKDGRHKVGVKAGDEESGGTKTAARKGGAKLPGGPKAGPKGGPKGGPKWGSTSGPKAGPRGGSKGGPKSGPKSGPRGGPKSGPRTPGGGAPGRGGGSGGRKGGPGGPARGPKGRGRR
jgi:hypothetical protein